MQIHYHQKSKKLFMERERDPNVQCLKSSLVSVSRGGRIYCMILESLSTTSHHFILTIASSFFSPISSTCLTICLHHIIFDRPHPLIPTTSKSNILASTHLSQINTFVRIEVTLVILTYLPHTHTPHFVHSTNLPLSFEHLAYELTVLSRFLVSNDIPLIWSSLA